MKFCDEKRRVAVITPSLLAYQATQGWLIVFILLASFVTKNTLAETDSTPTFYSFQYENDAFISSGTDRYYTSGIQFSSLKKAEPPQWLGKVSDWTPFYKKGKDLSLVQYTFGQKMFTPADIGATTLQLNDRPYAGYLFFGASVLSHIERDKNTDYGNQFEITMGIVGPSALGEDLQTNSHELIGAQIPNGWQHQLKDELTLGLNYSRFRRFIKPMYFGLELGVNSQLSGALGNVYTYGAAGVMFRLGKHLNRDLSPPNIRPGFPGLTYFQSKNQSSWYFYFGLEGRAVLRNIFLDGNTFADSHSVEKENFVADVQYGFVYLLGNIRFAISNMVRSKEFKTQLDKSNYGLINVSYMF